MKKNLVSTIALPVVGGMVAGYLANKSTTKNKQTQAHYKKLQQPPFSPPATVFPITWTGLYTTMGIAHYLVTQAPNPSRAEKTYYTQLGLNFLWSFLFFRLQLRGTALIESFILLGAVLLTVYEFNQKNKMASYLLLPYAAWSTFATYLNFGTWYLNK